MSSKNDLAATAATWKATVSMVDRYSHVRKLQAALPQGNASDAITIEQDAFQGARSRAEYEAACAPPPCSTTGSPIETTSIEHATSSPGVHIGSFANCCLIAQGVTSEVYRCGAFALKVITQHAIAPHHPAREAAMLRDMRPPIIPLLDVFRDSEQRLVLQFPYLPLTLADVLEKGSLSKPQLRGIFSDVLRALQAVHEQGIIHRDIKPLAVLLQSSSGPAYLSDFGMAWHRQLSARDEPPNDKILDIGTGPYRAPEVLFADKSYDTPIDMWGFGAMLAESIRDPPKPLFESRSAHEDGSQLGLILSIFKTLGTPTVDTWPEAARFKVSPFEMWAIFPSRSWVDILPDVDAALRNMVSNLVRYDSSRMSAAEALKSFQAATELSDTSN